jgi:hypothetical protein
MYIFNQNQNLKILTYQTELITETVPFYPTIRILKSQDFKPGWLIAMWF